MRIWSSRICIVVSLQRSGSSTGSVRCLPPVESGLRWTTSDSPRRQEGIRQARAAGTALIGDVTNTLVTVPLLREAEMAACVFHELIGFAGLNADEQVSNARRAIESLPVVADSIQSGASRALSARSCFSAIRHALDDPKVSCRLCTSVSRRRNRVLKRAPVRGARCSKSSACG